MLIGARLKSARINQKMTQEQLGKLVGVSKATISLYESEKRSPKLETIMAFIYALGVSADYLLGSDVIVEIKDAKTPKYRTFTKEECEFIELLRKDEFVYDILIQNAKRGYEIIKQRIG